LIMKTVLGQLKSAAITVKNVWHTNINLVHEDWLLFVEIFGLQSNVFLMKNIKFHVRETAWRNWHIDPSYLSVGFVSVFQDYLNTAYLLIGKKLFLGSTTTIFFILIFRTRERFWTDIDTDVMICVTNIIIAHSAMHAAIILSSKFYTHTNRFLIWRS
jgi:hypothetical protein